MFSNRSSGEPGAQRQRRRKLLAGVLATGLVFTIAPGSVAWALDAPVEEVPAEQEAPTSDESTTPSEVTEDAPTTEADAPADKAPVEEVAPAEASPLSAAADDAPIGPLALGDGTLSLTFSQNTGTEPFQDNDDPGNDSGMDNDIVRTNDTVTYNLGIRYEGDDHTAPTVKFTVPKGQQLVNLPPYCLAGSSVTPAALPDPAVPLTATSWEALPVQEVTCVLKDEAMGTSLNYSFVTQVRAEVPNGTTMDPMVIEVSSDQAFPVETDPMTQTVSAAAKFDLSKRGPATQANQGALFQGSLNCSRDASQVCRTLQYPVSITVPAGGKGTMPLKTPIIFEDNLDPASFYGATMWATMVTAAGSEAAARSAYAPSFRGCSKITNGSGFRSSLPYSSSTPGYSSDESGVRETGTLTCPATAPGENGVITVTDTDTTATTVPSTTGSGNAISSNLGYVVTFELAIEYPQAAVLEFGDADGDGVYVLSTHNEYTNIQMTGIDDSENVGENPDNNVRDASVRLQTSGTFDKSFGGIFGTPGNTSSTDFSDNVFTEGPPGSGVRKDGNTVVMPGQAVESVLSFGAEGPAGTGTDFSRTYVSCDVWDPSRLALAAHPDWRGNSATSYPSNGEPVFVTAYRQANANRPTSSLGNDTSVIRNLKVEYSSGPAGAGSSSDCSSGTWVSDPTDVPGATSTVDALGRTIWSGVNRVRVTFNTEWLDTTPTASVILSMAIGQVVLDSEESTPIGNWASQVHAGGVNTTEETLAASDKTVRLSAYDPETHGGILGDRLIQGEAIVRVQKYVENPQTGEFVNTAVPQFAAGATVRYRINPSLSTSIPVEGKKYEVVVEDCLPRFQLFESSEQDGTAITPELVQMGAPADSEITCASNRQYIRWNLGERAVGEPITPIIIAAETLDVARNGVYSNEVTVSSPADNSPVAVRSDDVQMQLVVPTGIKISKTVDKPVIEVNPEGVTNPRTLTWSVFFANIDGPPNVANVDVIDVLPATGRFTSDFAGSLEFNSATPVAGDNITVLYSKAASADLATDPNDPTNAADGATVWCDAATGGVVVIGDGTAADCPAATAEVTGLRFQRPGEFNPDDEFQVDIKMTPIGNVSGDKYRNLTAGQVDGVTQGVGPARRDVTVVASSVGDRVWEDTNSNGLQDDGEPGVAGVMVRLVGSDVDGNAVDLETVTDEDGNYRFAELASGTYKVIFDPATIPSNARFTSQHTGSSTGIDSDANTTTGESQEFVLGIDTDDLSLDAGLITADGALVINKVLEGAGVAPFGGDDELTFQVVCTLDDTQVLDQEVTLQVNGGTSVTSEPIAPIPALSECTVTETGAGDADKDSLPDPVTVTIPWDGASAAAGTVTASLTNYYSAGQIQLEKVLEGDSTRIDQVKDTEFSFLITCQIEEENAAGETVRTDVVSGTWKIKGGEVIILGTDDVDPIHIPLGARCFGEEADDGGATKTSISHDSYDNAVEVTEGSPAELQTLNIKAVNQFLCDKETCGVPTTVCTENCTPDDGSTPPGVLSITGAAPGLLLWGALGLLLTGAAVLYSRRRQVTSTLPSP